MTADRPYVNRRDFALAIFGSVVMLATIVGAVFAGIEVASFGWGWNFLFVPVAICVVLFELAFTVRFLVEKVGA